MARSQYASANGSTGRTAVVVITTPGMFPISWNGSAVPQYNNPFNPGSTGTAYVVSSALVLGTPFTNDKPKGAGPAASGTYQAASGCTGGSVTGFARGDNIVIGFDMAKM